MKQKILKIIENILKNILREMLLDILQNRIVLLKDLYKKNRNSYDKTGDILMKAKIQALEEAYTVIASFLQ